MSVLLIEPRQELETLVAGLASDLGIEVTREPSSRPRLVIFDGDALPAQEELDRLRREIGPASALLAGDAQVLAEAASRSWAPLVVRGLLFTPLDEGRLTEQLLEARAPDPPAAGRPEGVLLITGKAPAAPSLRELLPESCSLELASALPEAWQLCRQRRFEAILVDLRLTHRRTWERIVSLQPGARTLALVQRRHSARRRATTSLRVGGSLTVPFSHEEVRAALGELMAPRIPVEDGVRRVPPAIDPELLFEALARALDEDAQDCLTTREIDLLPAELEPEALAELCPKVEGQAAGLGISITWTHAEQESDDPEPDESSEAA